MESKEEYAKQYQKMWREAHPGYHKQWRLSHPDYWVQWWKAHPCYGKQRREANPNYHKGHHPDFRYKPRLGSNNPRISIKKQCLKRDKYVCQICGQASSQLDIHHLDNMGPHLTKTPNNDLSNLQTLCHKCHLRLHYGVIEKHREITELRKAGLTLEEIGQQFGGVSRQRIHQILLQNIL